MPIIVFIVYPFPDFLSFFKIFPSFEADQKQNPSAKPRVYFPSLVPIVPPVGLKTIRFDHESRVLTIADLEKGGLRLFDVDQALVLPIHTNIQLLFASNDVIHS